MQSEENERERDGPRCVKGAGRGEGVNFASVGYLWLLEGVERESETRGKNLARTELVSSRAEGVLLARESHGSLQHGVDWITHEVFYALGCETC